MANYGPVHNQILFAFFLFTSLSTASAQVTIQPPYIIEAGRNRQFSYSFSATGGTAPYAWVLGAEGLSLPPGMQFDPSAGRISGVSDRVGYFYLPLQARDTKGATSQPVSIQIRVEQTEIQLFPSEAPLNAGVDLIVRFDGLTTSCAIFYDDTFIGNSQTNGAVRGFRAYFTPGSVGGPGVHRITLRCGTFVTDPAFFTAIGVSPATISGLSPPSIEIGSPALTLLINGSQFSPTDVVWYGGVAQPTTYVSASQLAISLPAGLPPGSVTVVVKSKDQLQASNFAGFAVLVPTPVITSIQPTQVLAGSPAFDLVINGNNFLSDTVVQWGSTNTFLTPFARSRTSLAVHVDSSLVAQPQSGLIITAVNLPDSVNNRRSNGIDFPVRPVPYSITSVQPSSVVAGAGTTTLFLSGSGFRQGMQVLWRGPGPSPNAGTFAVTVLSSTQISLVVPGGWLSQPGSVEIQVQDTIQSISIPFTITMPVPVISSVTPNPIAARSQAIPLTLNGSGFLPTTRVFWNGTQLGTQTGTATSLTTGPIPDALLALPGIATVVAENPGSARSNSFTVVVGPASPALVRAIVNAASSQWNGKIAPGEIVTLYGDRIGPPVPQVGTYGPDGRLLTELAGYSVRFGDKAAPLLYLSESQVSAIVPFAASGNEVSVWANGTRMAQYPVAFFSAIPGIFTADNSHSGPAVAINQDGTLNGPNNPARPGSAIVFYATGLGQTSPQSNDGEPAADPFPKPVGLVRASVNGNAAEVLYAGGAPGFTAGLMQVNVRIPQSTYVGLAQQLSISVSGSESNSATVFVAAGQ